MKNLGLISAVLVVGYILWEKSNNIAAINPPLPIDEEDAIIIESKDSEELEIIKKELTELSKKQVSLSDDVDDNSGNIASNNLALEERVSQADLDSLTSIWDGDLSDITELIGSKAETSDLLTLQDTVVDLGDDFYAESTMDDPRFSGFSGFKK